MSCNEYWRRTRSAAHCALNISTLAAANIRAQAVDINLLLNCWHHLLLLMVIGLNAGGPAFQDPFGRTALLIRIRGIRLRGRQW